MLFNPYPPTEDESRKSINVKVSPEDANLILTFVHHETGFLSKLAAQAIYSFANELKHFRTLAPNYNPIDTVPTPELIHALVQRVQLRGTDVDRRDEDVGRSSVDVDQGPELH